MLFSCVVALLSLQGKIKKNNKPNQKTPQGKKHPAKAFLTQACSKLAG